MDRIKIMHRARIITMLISFLIEGMLDNVLTRIYGYPSVTSVILMMSIFLLCDFIVILITKGDVFKTESENKYFNVWKKLYRITFIIEGIIVPILLVWGIIDTVQNVIAI